MLPFIATGGNLCSKSWNIWGELDFKKSGSMYAYQAFSKLLRDWHKPKLRNNKSTSHALLLAFYIFINPNKPTDIHGKRNTGHYFWTWQYYHTATFDAAVQIKTLGVFTTGSDVGIGTSWLLAMLLLLHHLWAYFNSGFKTNKVFHNVDNFDTTIILWVSHYQQKQTTRYIFSYPHQDKKKQQQLTPSDKGLQPCDRMKFCAKKSKSLWASYQIRKIAGCACAGNAGNVFPRRRFQRKPIVSDPGMHHGTCVTHVPWCMSGSLTCGDGENVPGIPGACAPAILRIWQEAHGVILKTSEDSEMLVGYDKTTGKFNWYCISPNEKTLW